MAHVDTRRLSRSDLDVLRQRGIDMWRSGIPQAQVARELGVRPATVHSWTCIFKRGGLKALATKTRGRKRSTLTVAQSNRLRRWVEGKLPGQLRLDFALWTTDAVLTLIKNRFAKTVSKRTVHRLLYEWGFTPKKAARRAWQQDFGQVQTWTTETYPNIAVRAKRCKARIFWADETGIRSDDTTTRGWSPKGKPAIMMTNGRRHTCNVISAINNQGGLAFEVFKGGFRAKTFIGFMKRLIAHAKDRKVFLIVDQHPAHKAKVVQAWLDQHRDSIEIFFLPGYSPELNPDEFLNHDLKAQTVRRTPPISDEHLLAMVRDHLRSRQRSPKTVARFFLAPSVRYAG
jgi:transposase